MLKFTKIEIQNFISIGKASFDVDEGITAVFGLNGSGKSTILEAWFVGLTDTSYKGITKSELRNWVNKQPWCITIHGKLDNKDFILTRAEDSVKFVEKDENGNEQELKYENRRDFQTKIEEKLSFNRKLLEHIVFLSNKTYRPYLNLPSAERKALRDKFFNIEDLDKFDVYFKDKLTENENLISDKKVKLQLFEQKIQTLKDVSNNTITMIENDIQKKTDELQISLDSFDNKLYEQKKSELETILETLPKTKEHIDSIEERLTWKKEADKQFADLKQKEKDTKEKIEKNKKITDLIKVLEDEIVGFKGSLKKIEIEPEKIEEMINAKREVLYSFQSEQVKTKKELDDFKKVLEFYNHNTVCPVCKQNIDQNFLKTQIENLTKSISDNETKNKELSSSIEKTNKEISDLHATKNTAMDLKEHNKMIVLRIQGNKDTIEREKQHIVEVEDLNKIEDEILLLGDQIMHFNMDFPGIEKELEETKNKHKKMLDKRLELELDIKDFEHKAEMIEKLKKEKEELVVKRTETEQKCKTNLEKVEAEHQERIDEIAKLEERHIVLTIAHEFFYDRRGKKYVFVDLKHYIINERLALINRLIKKFSEDFSFPYSIKLINDGLDAEITYLGRTINFVNFSDGEQQKINIIILFSFLEFVKIIYNNEFPLLFLDELTAPFDFEAIELFYDILGSLKSNIAIYSISHKGFREHHSIKTYIDVEKHNRFSSYKINKME